MAQTETTELTPAEAVLPASFAQQRMWFLERFEGGAVYNVPVATRLRGSLDVDALERALAALIERHESLRTVFTLVEGAPHQVIRAPRPFSLRVIDHSGSPDAVERALEIASERARAPFDLSREEPLRVVLVKLGDDDHLLSLTLHHIVTDAWSMGILSRELGELYAGFRSGSPAKLPELEIQYGDYAVWQRQWMESGGLDQQLEYWRGQLEGAPPLLELPTDLPRPSRQSFRGATVRAMLPRELRDQVRALGEREGVTTFMTLLAAFSVLLSRYSGQEDVVVASPVANRTRTELERVIGPFVNTLALRVRPAGDMSFSGLVRHVREVALGAFSNQDLPFEKLVETLAPERHLSHAPVAQVMFVVQNAVERTTAFPELEQERVLTDRGTAKFDLTLFAAETPEGLRLSLEYCSDLFEEETAKRMLDHYRVLLEAALADPDTETRTLPILTGAELRTLLSDWNDTAAEVPDRAVHELVAEQARRAPSAIAVQCGDDRLTYGELDARANQLARHLATLGVGPDVLVGICVERSVAMVVAVLGILKAGGAYVPIDPAYPAERQAYMLDNAGAPVVLSQEHLQAGLPAGDRAVVLLDRDWPAISRMPDDAPEVVVSPTDLSYVIYTSGSTGEPKGVQLPQRALANLLATMRETPGLGTQDVLLAITTLSFDIASLELLLPLICGARVVVAPTEATTDPNALIELLERSAATVMQATPTTWKMLVEAGWAGRPGLKAITGGEALTAALAGELLARGLELWNGYGPSETTIYSTRARVRDAERIVIGRPVANTTLYVLDEAMQPVPVGVPGELWIGGIGLARGYRGRPDLTAERFVRNPFDSRGDARIYRTGDVVRYLPDGDVEYIGRADHQVKVRGFRIELGEVEAGLRRHQGIRDAVVVAREDDTGDTTLVAYLTADTPAPDASELRALLQRTLPDFMIPSAFVALAAFPLTPNGKIDRKALPAPDDTSRATGEYVAPRTELERALAEIWQQVLTIERVGAHDDFFALGGHSLLATKLVSRVQERLRADVPLRAVFEAPTLETFAAAVERARAATSAVTVLPALRALPRTPRRLAVAPGEDVYVLPTSYAERRLWFLDRFEPDSAAYNVPLAVRLRGALDVEALERALNGLAARHESLRTVFTLIDGVPHRVVRPPRPTSLSVTDLGGLEDAEERARALVRQDSARPFDLEVGPLLRAGLLRLSQDEHVFVLTLHHIIVDAWSIGVLNRELSALYAASLEGRSPELPDLPIQYGDFAASQEEWIASGALDAELDYWRGRLAGAPALLDLPTDRVRPTKQSFRGATLETVIPKRLAERVRALGEQERTTRFMTLLTAFGVLLSRYSGQEDVVIASPIANRDRIGLEGVIGLFVNTLALRLDLSGDPSFRELLARVRSMSLEAFSNQHVQFEKLVEELNPERHLSHAPIAQVMFVLAEASGEGALELPGLEAAPFPRGRETAKFDLSLFAGEKPDGLHLLFEYCTDLFDRATVVRMSEHFGVLLEALLADPDRPVGQLRLLGAGEEGLVVHRWNETARSFATDRVRPVHELVAEQSRRTPEATAVELAGQRLTYAQLDGRANGLARRLRELGVGPGAVVGICAERSLETVVGVLAVLKAGGAYAPIDPAYPEERVAFMLSDSAAPVLLTQERLLASLPAHGARTVCLDSDWDENAGREERPPEGGATLDELAYVIYTSGSTGQPKGVAMPHRPLANLLAWQLDCWAEQPPARTLQFASLSFDVAFQELFSTWCSGGALILIDEQDRRDAQALLRVLAEQRVERLFLPFVALQNLCEAADYLGATLPGLREVITAGEQLKATEAIRRFFERHPGCTLVNQYGPTESHVVTAHKLTGPPEQWPALPPIGRPIANARVYLLDRHRRPVPIGIPGELCIGGVSLADGYLGRPEWTAERFVPDPFAEDTGARVYRTGDLARYRPDGEIEYLGRADHQVKVRGFRVEPGEVESVLREHPAVREALVLTNEDGGDKRLVAYLVADRASLRPHDLRERLRRSLPDYMIPAAFAFLDAFPLSPNGKVDRAQLARTPFSGAEHGQTRTLPRDETERELVAIWEKVLAVEGIGVHDNFFELGGHSLLAVRLFAEIERRLRTRLPLSTLFETATVAGLAEMIGRGRDHQATSTSLVRLRAGNDDPPLFLVGWAGGEVIAYRDLVENLAPELTVFGLRAPGVDRRRPPLGTVEELAAHYVGEIREAQPHGPYRLAGFCFSGLVAYEMTRVLQGLGETVSTLALIDAYPYRPPGAQRGTLEVARVQLKALRDAGPGGRREWLRRRRAGIGFRIHNAVYLKIGPRLYELLSARNLQRLLPRRPWNPVLIASNCARRRYVPKPLDVRLAFFRAQREPGSAPTPWDGLATGGVELRQIVIPGITHDSMMREPHVRMLAAEVTRQLSETARATAGEPAE
jgi:amino acid adenylation domain-containing protein